MSYMLTVDAASDALSTSLIPAVQAAYDAGPGYPPLVITQAYVLLNAVHVGLRYWIPPRFFQPSYPRGEPATLPTVAKLTPSVAGFANYPVNVTAADIAYAADIITAIGGGVQIYVLGCALCTGLAMMNGLLPVQVGPWIAA